jgi:hypothetical protein
VKGAVVGGDLEQRKKKKRKEKKAGLGMKQAWNVSSKDVSGR